MPPYLLMSSLNFIEVQSKVRDMWAQTESAGYEVVHELAPALYHQIIAIIFNSSRGKSDLNE